GGAPIATYAKLMQERLAREVQICGVSEDNAIEKLRARDVDFAFVTTSAPAAPPEDVRPILSWREQGELPRARFVTIALDQELTLSPPPDALVVGYSRDEVRRALAFRDGGFSDTPAAKDAASQYLGDTSKELSNRKPNVNPIEVVTTLRSAGPGSAFIMTEGRFDIFCSVNKEACEGLETSPAAFAPIHQAFAVRADMSGTLAYRLIGIHVQMHHRFREAFEALAPDGMQNLEPTEPGALGNAR
ncbi:MAG: hypothetical protein AAFY19_07170, partial [Pseudomonadota bacterium]